MANNQFIKLTADEFEVLKPTKRTPFSPLEAYMDLKMLLFGCNRVETRKVQGEVVTLQRWEKEVSLRFLMVRWNWKDASRVKYHRDKWIKAGFLKLRKSPKGNFDLLSITIVALTPISTPISTEETTPISTPNSNDNQRVTKGLFTPISTPISTEETTRITTDVSTKKRSKEVKEITSTTTGENLQNFEKNQIAVNPNEQAGKLVDFFKTDMGRASVKICFDGLKKKTPSTNLLVTESYKFAQWCYLTFGKDFLTWDVYKMWAQFSRSWAGRIGQKPPTTGKVKNIRTWDGKRADKRVDNSKFDRIETGKAGLIQL